MVFYFIFTKSSSLLFVRIKNIRKHIVSVLNNQNYSLESNIVFFITWVSQRRDRFVTIKIINGERRGWRGGRRRRSHGGRRRSRDFGYGLILIFHFLDGLFQNLWRRKRFVDYLNVKFTKTNFQQKILNGVVDLRSIASIFDLTL